MKKFNFFDLIKYIIRSIAKSYSGKRFLPSLFTGLLTALVSTILSVFVLKDRFSDINLLNQILCALFMYLSITTLVRFVGDITCGKIFKRFGNTLKNQFTGYFTAPLKVKIWMYVITLIFLGCGFLLSLFVSPLFTILFTIAFFLSAVAGSNSYLLLIGTLILKKFKVLVFKDTIRGRYLTAASMGMFLSLILFYILSACNVITPKSPVEQTKPSTITESTSIPGTLEDTQIPSDLTELPTSQAPYKQSHTIEELTIDSSEGELFPIFDTSVDYLITSFDGMQSYSLCIFDSDGEITALYGRKKYSSTDALLAEYPDLSDSAYSEEGYTYCNSILYYKIPESLLEDTLTENKAIYLYYALSGSWDSYYYFFSMPYFDNVDGLSENDSSTNDSFSDDTDPEDTIPGDSVPGGDSVYDDSPLNNDYDSNVNMSVQDASIDLFKRLSQLAGKDYEAFCDLFRNVDSSIIDQYYNLKYPDLSIYEHTVTSILASTDKYAYVTVIFYTVPADYPDSNVSTYLFNTILGQDDDGIWKLEYNDTTLALLHDDYQRAISTEGGYQALMNGLPWARPWAPFDTRYALYFEGAFICKPIEYYIDPDGNINLTLYISNATGMDVTIDGINSLVIADGNQLVTDVSSSLFYASPDRDATLYNILIPAEYVEVDNWTNPQIVTFNVNIVY